MKTIKNGLVAAAFALSGCGGVTLKQLSDGEVFYPSEKAVLEDLYVDGGECTSAEVTFNRYGYSIRCDNEHYFDFDHFEHGNGEVENSGKLVWGDVRYHDNDIDEKVDWIVTDGNIVDVNDSDVDFRYNSLVSELNNEKVYQVWRDRWGCRN